MKSAIILMVTVMISSACFADTVFVHNTVVIPDSVLVKYANRDIVKESIWEKNAGSIITALVSIFAIGFTLLTTNKNLKSSRENLDKQLEAQNENFAKQLQAQMATTIHKEWVEKVRGLVAEIIEYSVIMGSFKQSSTSNSVTKEQYENTFLKFQTNQMILGLYLNFDIASEKDIYDKIAQLRGDSEDGLMGQVNTKIREIHLMAQKLFNSKLQ
jgi:hypothetical protein